MVPKIQIERQTCDEWNYIGVANFFEGLYGAIERYGLLKDLSKFDAKFFNIHPKQAERMDPQIRNLLEVVYEATVDAGKNWEKIFSC